jgi:hypothetical protein
MIGVLCHQFAGSAKHWNRESHRGADPGELAGNHGVVNVPAVPGEQRLLVSLPFLQLLEDQQFIAARVNDLHGF